MTRKVCFNSICIAIIAIGIAFICFDSWDIDNNNISVTHLDKTSYAKLFELKHNETEVIPMIDIVITWAGMATNENNQNNIRTRYNEELKYCLRSLYQNIPWFNKIYIVVNNETYHNIYNTETTFIDRHKLIENNRMIIINTFDLFCIYNQCYDSINNTNSESIETVLHRIPNLSEYYIYFNDDVFIGSSLHWTFFFHFNGNVYIPQMPYMLYKFYRNGVAVPWYLYWFNYLFLKLNKYEWKPYMNTYRCNMDEIKQLNIDIPNEQMTFYGDHMPRTYVKQNWINFENKYLKWFAFVRSHKIRYYSCGVDSMPESITKTYMKWKLFVNISNININLLYYPIYDDLYYNILVRLFYNGFIKMTGYHYSVNGHLLTNTLLLKYHLMHISMLKPATININDDGQSMTNMKIIRDFYANYLPLPSPIEKVDWIYDSRHFHIT